MARPTDTENLALFCDFENIAIGVRESKYADFDIDKVVERLSTKYGESRQSIGMAPKGRVVEIYASLETGTWTITVTTPNGITCLVASGQSFENLEEPIEPAGIRS